MASLTFLWKKKGLVITPPLRLWSLEFHWQLPQVPPGCTFSNENAPRKHQSQLKVLIEGSTEEEIIALLKEMRDGKDEKITE